MKREWFGGLVRAVVRRPMVAIAVVAVLAAGGAILAFQLEPSTGTDTLVSSDSDTFKATERFKKDFGDDAVVVLVKGDLQRTVLTEDLGRLIKFEGCLSGNVPAAALKTLPPACSELAKLKPAKVVFGPGTFINTASGQISDEFVRRRDAQAKQASQAAAAAKRASAQRGDPPAEQERLANAARQASQSEFTRQLLQIALRYGITGLPSVDNPDFVSTLVFDSKRGVGQPKARFAYLFPSKNAAMIQVRLRPDLSERERERAIELIKEAAASKDMAPQRGAKFIVSGVPVVVEGLADSVRSEIFVLLAAALVLMAATLALVFKSRLRLLPLAIALAAAAMTFGLLSLFGGDLTMASIAVLPVLIGLAVDYAIQFQARHNEEMARVRSSPDQRSGSGPPSSAQAAERAAGAGGPTIATAGLATGAGFLVLLLSPVPMVRGFGGLLIIGIAIALMCALTAGFAALVRFAQRKERDPDIPPVFERTRARARSAGRSVADSRVGVTVGDWLAAIRGWLARRGERAIQYSIARPARVLCVGLAIAIGGWAVEGSTEVISDVQELVPQDLQALKDVDELQGETGVSGEIDVTVRADDITDPAVIGWMANFQQRMLRENGYKAGATCQQKKNPPDLCPAFSLTDLFGTTDITDRSQVTGLLDAVPPYFSQGVVTADRKTANMAFGIRLQSLDDQKEVVDRIKSELDPPKGVQADVVGLPVMAAEANGSLSSHGRRALTLVLALLAVFLVLALIRRSRRAAAVPLIPIALATGWSAALLFLLGLLPDPLAVKLNPMSVTLGALVIAISTEFSVLLTARYREEREAGVAPAVAIERTYASTGAAVLASGVTAIAGFAALIASEIRMLRDFGILTVVDLSVSLIGVMIVLPAALIWAENHGPFSWRDLDPRPFFLELWDALRDGFDRIPRPRGERKRPSIRALRPRRRA